MAFNLKFNGSTSSSNFSKDNVFHINVGKFVASEWLPYSRWNDTTEEYIKIKDDGTTIQFSDIVTATLDTIPTDLIFNPRVNIVHSDINNPNAYIYDGCYYTWLYKEFGSDYNVLKLYVRNNELYELDFSIIQNLGFKKDSVKSIYLVANVDDNGSVAGVRPIVNIAGQYYIICPLLPQAILDEWVVSKENPDAPVKDAPAYGKLVSSSGVFNVGLNYPPTRHTEYLDDVFPENFNIVSDCANARNCLVYDFYINPSGAVIDLVTNGEYGSVFTDVENGLIASIFYYDKEYNKETVTASNFVGYKDNNNYFVPFLSAQPINFDYDMFPFEFNYEGKKITVSMVNNKLTFADNSGNTISYSIELEQNSRTVYHNLMLGGGFTGLYIVKNRGHYEVWVGIKFVGSDQISHDDVTVTYNCGIYALGILPQWVEDFFDDAGINEGGIGENDTTESLVKEELGGELGTGELADVINDKEDWNKHDGTMGNGTGNPHEGDAKIPDPIDDLPVTGGEGSVLGSGFIKVYTPTKSQLDDFTSELLEDDVLDVLKAYFTTNPMDGIIGLHMLPYKGFSSQTTGTAKIGTYKFDAPLNVAGKEWLEVDYGTIKVDFAYDGYENYSTYSDCKIYLPHIGYKEIDIDMIQGCEIHLKYIVSLVTGDIYAYLYAKWVGTKNTGSTPIDHLLYHWQGNCTMQVPVTHIDKSSYINGAIQTAGNIASIVASGATMSSISSALPMAGSQSELTSLQRQYESAGYNIGSQITSAGGNIASMFKPKVTTSGSITGATGYISSKTPYLLMSRPIIVGADDIKRHYGMISATRMNVAELKGTGFTTLDGVDLNGVTATEEELNELKSILEGGFYA